MEKHYLYAHLPAAAPTDEELRAMLGDRAYPACKAVRDFVQVNYSLKEAWRYSDKRDAFDCLFWGEDLESPLCSIHAHKGSFSLLVLLDERDCDTFLSQSARFSEKVLALFEEAPICSGEKWIRVVLEDSAARADILSLIRFKAARQGR